MTQHQHDEALINKYRKGLCCVNVMLDLPIRDKAEHLQRIDAWVKFVLDLPIEMFQTIDTNAFTHFMIMWDLYKLDTAANDDKPDFMAWMKAANTTSNG